MNQRDKESFKKEIRERLKWYTFEAGEDEIDVKEMEALAELLEALEGKDKEKSAVPDGERALESFRDYKKRWETDQKRLNRGVNDEKVLKGRNRRFGAFLHSRRAVVGLTAAVLVAVVALGGVVGVNAERNGGFFHWIQRDDTGITVITNPSGLNVEMVEKSTGTYYRLEDVPESFRKYVLRQEDLVMLEGFTFEQVEISQMSNFVKISSLYTQEETHNELRLGMICFANVVSYNRYDFLDSKYLYSTEKDGIELQVFSQEDEGEREYLVQFFFGEAQYYVQGEMSIDFLESFAEEYYDFVSN